LATGHQQFGQQGRVESLHLPWLGSGFFLVVPILGELVYGPLIQRFAREARGHGVPEVMIAVADDGGRIRPQVTVVKALASALCIGAGGSVGRTDEDRLQRGNHEREPAYPPTSLARAARATPGEPRWSRLNWSSQPPRSPACCY
jgi:Voltage gated chloride channel